MQMSSRRLLVAALLVFGVCAFGSASIAQEQDTTVISPDEATKKAKQLIQQAIDALGGQAYLSVRDITYEGRLSSFDHANNLTGFEKFIDYEKLPGKERQENLPKRNIVSIFNGNEGWLMDRGGVQEAPEDSIANFEEDRATDIDNILRNRVHEPDMNLHYAGPDVVDLKEVEWLELNDSDDRNIRIAFAKYTHLPVQEVVTTRDPQTKFRTEQVEYYSNYHAVDGITSPFQILREKNKIKVFQVFFDDIKYNTDLSDSLFTKESLDDRWAQIGKKERKKEQKEKEKEKEIGTN